MNEQIKNIALNVVQLLLERGYTLSTAESCTGGSIAAAITSIAGCSAVFKGSVVSYSNDVKAAVLDVDISTLAACGAVSEETVKQMAVWWSICTGPTSSVCSAARKTNSACIRKNNQPMLVNK